MADEVETGTSASAAPEATEANTAAGSGAMDFVLDVPLRVTVEIGSARMLVQDVLQLNKGSVIELDRAAGEPADILVIDRLVGRGEVTVIDDRLSVRVIELIGAERSESKR